MSDRIDRRRFMKGSVAASTGAALGFHFEEKALLAHAAEQPSKPSDRPKAETLPTGRIGDIDFTRLIVGGNLISGSAHARDLIYVSSLLRNYHTDDKVIETLLLCQDCGIDTMLLRLDKHVLRIVDRFWNKEGGKLKWICQVKPAVQDLTTAIDVATDYGAAAAYIQGGVGDSFWRTGRMDLMNKAVEHAKSKGVLAGVGAHVLPTVKASEEAGVDPDFYMKTINSKNYWSAGPKERHDSVFAETPEETIEFMNTVKKPWIGFKVLGAGAIHPREGFKYAFEKGTDFVCVGMFDFQVQEDCEIARETLSGDLQRTRPWCA